MTESPSTDALARTLWDYMLLGHELAQSDLILVLGSNNVRVAEHAAGLFARGLAPLMVCSGNVGRLTATRFARSEAETFADVAVANGVPRDAILLEPRATNSGENLAFTRALLEAPQEDRAYGSIFSVRRDFLQARCGGDRR